MDEEINEIFQYVNPLKLQHNKTKNITIQCNIQAYIKRKPRLEKVNMARDNKIKRILDDIR